MATYHNITKEEIESLLLPQKFLPMALPNTFELVYGRRIDRNGMPLSLRIYTGIGASGNSRSKGTDAIRVNLFYRAAEGEKTYKIGGSKRVHRVKGWRQNLQSRIDDWLNTQVVKCDKCGKPMAIRKSQKGEFWGCIGYPDCKNTLSKEAA